MKVTQLIFVPFNTSWHIRHSLLFNALKVFRIISVLLLSILLKSPLQMYPSVTNIPGVCGISMPFLLVDTQYLALPWSKEWKPIVNMNEFLMQFVVWSEVLLRLLISSTFLSFVLLFGFRLQIFEISREKCPSAFQNLEYLAGNIFPWLCLYSNNPLRYEWRCWCL